VLAADGSSRRRDERRIPLRFKNLVEHVRSSAQLAAILEVSGWPKPGNVHRTRDHGNTRYEHFLAGSVALGFSVGEAASKGLMAAEGRIGLSEIGLGGLVKKAVSDVRNAHKGGNTHLGVSLLFIPLAVAAAKAYVEAGELSPEPLRESLEEVMSSTTPRDTVDVYEAIRMASSPQVLGSLSGGEVPDLFDEQAEETILKEEITLLEVMERSSHYDTVARELATGMEVSFKTGYKIFTETFELTGDINVATVHTFLGILSEVPDTFIARKVGLKTVNNIEKAVEIGVKETMWISETARQILSEGGLTTSEGALQLWRFDEKLQSLGSDYNPGTTADLTANVLMIALLCGLKF